MRRDSGYEDNEKPFNIFFFNNWRKLSEMHNQQQRTRNQNNWCLESQL
jgi:hypothetical protein